MPAPAEAPALETSLVLGQKARLCLGARVMPRAGLHQLEASPWMALLRGAATSSAQCCAGVRLHGDFSGQKKFQGGRMCWAWGKFHQFLVFLPLDGMRMYPGVW